jgi:hypothetical protein
VNPTDILKTSKLFFKSNSPEILTGVAIVGVGLTAYLTAKASFTACDVIRSDEEHGGTASDPKQRLKERFKHTWKLYIPAGVSGLVTVGCIVGASKANANRTAAAVTAYSLTERAFSEYREKVVEEIGKNKEEKIRDAVAQDRLNKLPMGSVIVTGAGDVLCCETYTGRYFRSQMETLRKAQNDINAQIVQQLYVPLDEFYDLIGLPHTSDSDKLGWNDGKQMELIFSTALSEKQEPCMTFAYNYVKPL